MSKILSDMSNDYYLSSMETMLANLNGMIFNERAYLKISTRSGAWEIEVYLKGETEEDDSAVNYLTCSGDNAFSDICFNLFLLQNDIAECLKYLKVGEVLYYNVGTLHLDLGGRDIHFHGYGIYGQAKTALGWLKGREEYNGNDF